MVGNAAKHGGVNIPSFCRFGRIDITGNVQVISIAANLFLGDQPSKFFNTFRAGSNSVHNSLDIGCHQFVGLTNFGEALRSVNKKHIRSFAFLPQNHNNGGNARAIENICRQSDNCFDVVILDQITANTPLAFALSVSTSDSITTEQDTMREDDGHNTIWFYMVQVMKQEGIVSFPFWCHTIAITGIGFLVRRVPVL